MNVEHAKLITVIVVSATMIQYVRLAQEHGYLLMENVMKNAQQDSIK
jgi:hypothetical protein